MSKLECHLCGETYDYARSMFWHYVCRHKFSHDEAYSATGISIDEIHAQDEVYRKEFYREKNELRRFRRPDSPFR
ncbi:MAG: hypothetical protein PHV82_04905 [Victivallaceae bacterium]|nr:hypothetical protein [Victivallaceae bacterium]